jgi:hypothetical protein
VEVAGEIGERKAEVEDPFAGVRELLRLARRCLSPFEDGDESSYTQAELTGRMARDAGCDDGKGGAPDG